MTRASRTRTKSQGQVSKARASTEKGEPMVTTRARGSEAAQDGREQDTSQRYQYQKMLDEGWLVALVVKPSAAPQRCYVGQVQAVSSKGVRLSLADWVTGGLTGFDLLLPWESIASSLVCTDQHAPDNFLEAAARFQRQMNSSMYQDADGRNETGETLHLTTESGSAAEDGQGDGSQK